MSWEHLLVEDNARVRVITLNRPARRNAFHNAMYLELAHALDEVNERSDIRAIVLTGAGEMFSAGQDLAAMAEPIKEGTPIGFSELLEALQRVTRPLIGAVNGSGVGLGMTILLHTDMNLIAEKARFKLPFVTLGVIPEAASSVLLPRYFGYQRAAEILYTARWVDAEELLAAGLALRLLPAESVRQAAVDLAAAIAANPPGSVRHTRQLLRHEYAEPIAEALQREADGFRERLHSPENREAIAAFLEKRAPNFDGLE